MKTHATIPVVGQGSKLMAVLEKQMEVTSH